MRIGDRVRFRVGDVYIPQKAQLLEELDDRTELLGTLVAYSDSGAAPGAFGLVELTSARTVVVKVDDLRPAESGGRA